MTRFDQAEFEALQANIRERAATKVVLFYVGIAVWAALTVATTAVIVLPVAALLPLLVLAAGFEATASLHIGGERLGRSLRAVREREAVEAAGGEPADTPAAQAAVANRPRSADPIFSVIYVLAGLANFLPVVLTAQMREEIVAIGAVHALFFWRVLTLRRAISANGEL
jgi:hypothetical protein